MTDTNQASRLDGKLIGPMSAIIDNKRAELLPLLTGGSGQAAQAAHLALKDDECVRKVARFCYPLLPVLVRLAVKEPVFVGFVLNNRERLLA